MFRQLKEVKMALVEDRVAVFIQEDLICNIWLVAIISKMIRKRTDNQLILK